MSVKVMTCEQCKISIEADYPKTRLADLPIEHQRFIEMFMLASGSLKEIAQQTGVSYPTVRSRLDRIIEVLRARITNTGPGEDTILDALDVSDRRSEAGTELDARTSAKELIKRI